MDREAMLSPEHDVPGLNQGEHLLVWALRRLVIRPDVCGVVDREFTTACGEDAAEVLATLRLFLRGLAYTARRRINIGHPGSCALTTDERQILAMVAAAQQSDHGRLDASICWFARIEARGQLALATRALASAFNAHALAIRAAPPNGLRPITRPQLRLV